jgi:hypothetical protein
MLYQFLGGKLEVSRLIRGKSYWCVPCPSFSSRQYRFNVYIVSFISSTPPSEGNEKANLAYYEQGYDYTQLEPCGASYAVLNIVI